MASKSEWFKNLFINNAGLKSLALVLAALTFYSIENTISEEETYEVPVEVKLEKKIAVHSQDHKIVKVTLRGSQEDLRTVNIKQVKAVVRSKVTNYDESEQITIGPGNIEGISGVMVKKIRPNVITLTFDREVAKTFKIAKPEILGVPLIGKAEIDYEPRVVVIHGSKRRLEQVSSDVLTEPIDVDGRVESFSKRIRVLPPIDTWVSKIEPPEITANISIVTESISKELTNVLVNAIIEPHKAGRVMIEPKTVKVTLRGRPVTLDNIPDAAVKVFVDCSILDSSASYELPVNVHIPPGTDIEVSVEPEIVNVIYNKQE